MRIFVSLASTFVVLCLASHQAGGAAWEDAPDLPDSRGATTASLLGEKLGALKRDLFDRVNAHKPEGASDLGLHQYDPKTSDVSPEAVRRYVSDLESLEKRSKELEALSAALSDQDAIDLAVACRILASELHHWRDLKDYQTDIQLAQAPSDAINAVLLKMDADGEHAAEWEGVLSRTRQVPAFLAQARDNMRAALKEGRVADKRLVELVGIAGDQDAADFFNRDVQVAAENHLKPGSADLLGRLKIAAKAAGEAYLAHAEFLKKEILPSARESYALGEREYAWRLKNELGVAQSPKMLTQDAQKLADSIKARMEKISREIAPDKDLAAVIDELHQDHPADDVALFVAYREAAKKAREFVAQRNLFRTPNNYELKVAPTPKTQRAEITTAAYIPAPALDQSQKGVFLVTPSGGDAKMLAKHPFAGIPAVVVHEGFPGHDLQFFNFQNSAISPVRYLEAGHSRSMNVEGYALYAENLMIQNGFYKDPRQELIALQMQLWRAYRIVVDVGLHTETMSFADAVATLTQKAFLPEVQAKGEAFRYSKVPTQAVTYMLGRLQIDEIKDEYKKIMGDDFGEADFHQHFLAFGPVPPAQIRPVILDQARKERAALQARRDAVRAPSGEGPR